MQMMLEKPGFDINHIDYLGLTVLSYACLVGDLQTVQVSQSN
jgi:ankyrin repeat protein